MSFYDQIHPVPSLGEAFDPARYVAAPGDWLLVITDVVQSTEAIERGQHKTINMIAAACIAAVRNGDASQELPYSFGGDGVTLLVPPGRKHAALAALAGVRALAGEMGFALRVGAAAVGELRALGHDVRVARYQAAPGITFAMFRGGGVGHLERVLKGREVGPNVALHSLPNETTDPDLSGLSCRFEPIPSRGGCTVSIVVSLMGVDEDYRPILNRLLGIAGDDSLPIAPESLATALRRNWFPNRESVDFELDVAEGKAGKTRIRRRLSILLVWLSFQLSLRLGVRVGAFDAGKELVEKVRNCDFCKADDGLQMVIDCTPAQLAEIEAYLTDLEAAGALVFGMHVSTAALMTCLVDSTMTDHHVHFVDGAGGGYTRAAKAMKRKLFERQLRLVAEAALQAS
jgi:hypothetical protein